MNETINVSLFRLKQLKNIKRGKCLTILLPPFSYSHWKIWEASDFLFLPILAEAKKEILGDRLSVFKIIMHFEFVLSTFWYCVVLDWKGE